MSPAVTPWPEPVAGTPTVAVLEQALARHRLAHSLLLYGDDPELLSAVVHALADRLLNEAPAAGKAPAYFPPEKHPDFITIRPAGKMRMIMVDPFEHFLEQIQLSPSLSHRKVAVVFEADRLNLSTSNKFLKTLEEPPAGTTILLVTTRPYDLLPTIRSRCQRFSFKLGSARPLHPDVPAWLADYQAWLERLSAGVGDRKAACDSVFTLYGLIARFNGILDAATAEIWKAQKEKLPEDLEEEEIVAIETGIANGIRLRLFRELEQATREFALKHNSPEAQRALVATVARLEHSVGLLRLNLNESAALEDFLLASLRLWSRR